MADKPVTKPPLSASEHEEVLATASHRRVSLIWAVTQAIVAIMVTGSTLYVAVGLALKEESETAAFLLLSNVFIVIISTYIQKMNHKDNGGAKPGNTER